MLGSAVCRMHGGAAPQVRARAQQRILEASDKAAYALVQMLQDEKIPPAVRLGAARDLLDRAGLTSKQELTLDVKVEKNWEDVMEEVLVPYVPSDHIEDAVIVADPAVEAAKDEEMEERERARRKRKPLPSEDEDRPQRGGKSRAEVEERSRARAERFGIPLSPHGEALKAQQDAERERIYEARARLIIERGQTEAARKPNRGRRSR